MDDIELRRNDENYLNALGADVIPDPTTAGDFCGHFSKSDIDDLHDAVDEAKINDGKNQPESFFKKAVIDADRILLETTGQTNVCMDISWKGVWRKSLGYHLLLISLATTDEVIRLCNRIGNHPSEEGAAGYTNEAITICRRGCCGKIRYLFYITNDRKTSVAEIVYRCNDRCNQENWIVQLATLRTRPPAGSILYANRGVKKRS